MLAERQWNPNVHTKFELTFWKGIPSLDDHHQKFIYNFTLTRIGSNVQMPKCIKFISIQNLWYLSSKVDRMLLDSENQNIFCFEWVCMDLNCGYSVLN